MYKQLKTIDVLKKPAAFYTTGKLLTNNHVIFIVF